MIIQGSPDILQGPQGLNGQFGAFAAADDAVKQLYRDVLGREADPGGLQYFVDRFGDTVEPNEAAIFASMAQPEIVARDAFLAQQAAAAIEAANKKVIADAYAAAQAASAAAAQAQTAAAAQAAAAMRERAIAAVKALYLQVLGHEGDQAGINYFADRFGDVIDPDELQIFKDMAQPEIDARNKYLADMAAKSADDAKKAKEIADQFAKASADEQSRQAAARASTLINTVYHADGSHTEYYVDGTYETFGARATGLGPIPSDILNWMQPDPNVKRVTTSTSTISPALILAAAAAYFFAG